MFPVNSFSVLRTVLRMQCHYKTTVLCSSGDDNPCSSDFIKVGVSKDHSSLFLIPKGNFHIHKRLHTSLGSFQFFIDETEST